MRFLGKLCKIKNYNIIYVYALDVTIINNNVLFIIYFQFDILLFKLNWLLVYMLEELELLG